MSEWNSLYCETCKVECTASSNNTRKALEQAIVVYPKLQPILENCFYIEASILGCYSESSQYFEFLGEHYEHGRIIVTPDDQDKVSTLIIVSSKEEVETFSKLRIAPNVEDTTS